MYLYESWPRTVPVMAVATNKDPERTRPRHCRFAAGAFAVQVAPRSVDFIVLLSPTTHQVWVLTPTATPYHDPATGVVRVVHVTPSGLQGGREVRVASWELGERGAHATVAYGVCIKNPFPTLS